MYGELDTIMNYMLCMTMLSGSLVTTARPQVADGRMDWIDLAQDRDQ
jgi:hypothetical protein